MTKPKNLPVLGESDCKRCGETMPHQRCTGGRKVRIACRPCKREMFMTMEEYQEIFGEEENPASDNENKLTEPEADTGSKQDTTRDPEPAGEPDTGSSGSSYFF